MTETAIKNPAIDTDIKKSQLYERLETILKNNHAEIQTISASDGEGSCVSGWPISETTTTTSLGDSIYDLNLFKDHIHKSITVDTLKKSTGKSVKFIISHEFYGAWNGFGDMSNTSPEIQVYDPELGAKGPDSIWAIQAAIKSLPELETHRTTFRRLVDKLLEE